MALGAIRTMVARANFNAGSKLHRKALAVVAPIIAAWDPYGLLEGGAPADEFDSEISAVASQVSRIKSANDAAHVVSRVFSSSFEPAPFTPQLCVAVGNQLFSALEAAGLVT